MKKSDPFYDKNNIFKQRNKSILASHSMNMPFNFKENKTHKWPNKSPLSEIRSKNKTTITNLSQVKFKRNKK